MSRESEDLKNLLMLRDILKRRIAKLERELSILRRAVVSLDDLIIKQSVVTADQLGTTVPIVREREELRGEVVELRAEDGSLLGMVEIDRSRGLIRFEPKSGVEISALERPISSFLVRRIQEMGGEIDLDTTDEGIIRSLSIRVDPDRIGKVIRMVRWALVRAAH